MNGLIALFIAMLFGYLVLSTIWRSSPPPQIGLILPYAFGAGVGLSASGFLLLYLFGHPSWATLLILEVLIIAGITVWLWRSGYGPLRPADLHRKKPTPTTSVLLVCAALVCLFALAVFALRTIQEPHGGWDAWAIWNLRARFLFHTEAALATVLSVDLSWSHPDYPLLLPASVARSWHYITTDSVLAPVLIAFSFLAATAGLLFSLLDRSHGRNQALLAVIVLLGSTLYLRIAAGQFADIPLGFFILASLGALLVYDQGRDQRPEWLVLAGLMAASAAWTKNEGLLFFVCVALVRVFWTLRQSNATGLKTEATAFLLGATPIMAFVLVFKLFLAPENDIVSTLNLARVLEQVSDPDRYTQIIVAGFDSSYRLTKAAFILLPLYLILIGLRRGPSVRKAWPPLAAVLVLMLVGYLAVYVVTDKPLHWHLETSMFRLMAQLWPSALLLLFFVTRAPGDTKPNSPAA